MARSRANHDELDDIDLLNIHRYPESVSKATLEYFLNSRPLQKRLEELTKAMPAPSRRAGARGKGNSRSGSQAKSSAPPPRQPAQNSQASGPTAPGSNTPPPAEGKESGFKKFLKKLIP